MRPCLVAPLFVLLCLCLPLHAAVAAPDDPGDAPALVAALTAAITPLPDGPPLDWTDEDLRWLDDLAGPRILAFGEATHGTGEFTTARRRIFRYLAEHHGYRALVVEAHFTEGLFLDRCLADPDCDLAATMQTRMLFWTTRTQEMLGQLEWLREENLVRPQDARLHYLGCDSQVRDQIADALQPYLDAKAPELLEEARAELATLDGLKRADYEAMGDAALAGHDRRLSALRDRIAAVAADDASGAFDAACAARLVEAARQSLEFLQQYFHHGRLVRDRHLADTIAWLSRLFGDGTRIVLWAHNAHVAVDRGYAAAAGGGLGWQLRERFGDDYRCVALTFSRGEFRAKTLTADGTASAEPGLVAFDVEPPPGSLNRLLDGAPVDRFFLDLRGVDPVSDLGRWLAAPRAVLGVGDLYLGDDRIGEYHYGGDRVVTPTPAFDGLVHFARAGATEALAGGRNSP
jgi:erythromycin esterase